MKTNRIGGTAVQVSEISFGCAGIGNLFRKVSDEAAAQVLEHAWERGVRYFDTAPHYGRGLSEQRLGRFLKGRDRSHYVLSTKVGRLLSPGEQLAEADSYVEPLPNSVRYDYSGDGIEAAFEQSCERLGTSHVDIVYIHDIGTYTHGDANSGHMADLMASGIDRLRKLKEKGRIGAFGLGVNENEDHRHHGRSGYRRHSACRAAHPSRPLRGGAAGAAVPGEECQPRAGRHFQLRHTGHRSRSGRALRLRPCAG